MFQVHKRFHFQRTTSRLYCDFEHSLTVTSAEVVKCSLLCLDMSIQIQQIQIARW